MKINSIGTQLLSKLGSPDSRIPLLAKDLFNSAGYTYFSYDAGGMVEGKDRLVDEVGTGSIWLFGIPAYKKLIDKTIFKKSGISPDIDVRVVQDNKYLKKALDNAPTEEIYNDLKKAGNNLSKTKQLNFLKIVLSLGLTMASYFVLTKCKQNMTKKNIEKEFFAKQKEMQNNGYNNLKQDDSQIFKNFDSKEKTNPSFGSGAFMKTAEDFIFNPINNMLLLDLGISSQRLKEARTKSEFQEYAKKEGSFLFFVYAAGKFIAKGIDKTAELIKHPIGLDAKVLSSESAKDILNKKELQQEIKDFSSKFVKNSDNQKLYDFIFKNPENIVVKMAEKSGIISTVKDSAGIERIHSGKYIDPKKMKKLSKDLEKFIDFGANAKNSTSYLNRIKGFKIASTILNVAICCFALGYAVPKTIYKERRKNQGGNNDFHVKTEYEKELKEKHKSTLNK